VTRYLRVFATFWYDFLVGDRPELFIGAILVLGSVSVVLRLGLEPELAGGLLVALLLALVGLSVLAASRRPRG
jgi:hypothetical protein